MVGRNSSINHFYFENRLFEFNNDFILLCYLFVFVSSFLIEVINLIFVTSADS